jgi:hypothetical protein
MHVVFEEAGRYSRVVNPEANGTARFVDQYGKPFADNVSLVKPGSVTQTGVPGDVRNALNHFLGADWACGRHGKMRCSTLVMLPESDPVDRLVLLPEISEWLFASGFWKKVKSELGTIFDQYEEDEAPPAILRSFLPFLQEEIERVRELDECLIESDRGWDAESGSLKAQVGRAELLAELARLHELVDSACDQGRTLVFEW